MIDLLKNKKAIFFDVGYTLDYPASGDWMFTDKFREIAGEKFCRYSESEIEEAKNKGLKYLKDNHLVLNTEEEYKQFIYFYNEISRFLSLGLTENAIKEIAHDRTYNMKNYILYPDATQVLETLAETHKLGVISDTWPSIEQQLDTLGVIKYFSSTTYSCYLGTFKPDKLMYTDALEKIGFPAEDTVFIDDSLQNLKGAAELGITPILIAANPASDIDSPFLKIHSLKELL